MLVSPERIEFLKGIQDGWYDGEGKAIHPDIIQHLLDSKELPIGMAYSYPTLEGNVSLEWDSHHPRDGYANLPDGMDFFDVIISPSEATLYYGKIGGIDEEVIFPLDVWADQALRILKGI